MLKRIALALCNILLVVLPAESQTVKIRMGATSPVGTSVWRGAEIYRDTMNRDLGDLAQIELLPFGSVNVLSEVAAGTIQMAVIHSAALAPKAPQLALLDLPFFFKHFRELTAMQETFIGEVMLGSVNEGGNRDGLIGLAYWNAGMSQLFGRLPIEKTEQLKGAKFRTTVSLDGQIAARALGVVPTFVPAGEVAPALERGAIDLIEVLPAFVTLKAVPLPPTNHTELNYRPVAFLVVANAKFWRSLRVRVQTALVDQARAIGQRINSETRESERAITSQLAAMQFKTIPTSEAQFEAFAKVAEPGWAQVGQLQANGFFAGALSARDELRRIKYEVPPRRRSDALPGAPRMPIGFVTDRRDDRDPDPGKRFSAARGSVTYGHAQVAMDPARPHGQGDVDNVQLVDIIDRSGEKDFVNAVKVTMAQSQRREILLYVHGFSTLFKGAVESAAQIATDIRFQGATVVFSWPSDGTVWSYSSDGEDIDDSKGNFIALLKALSAASPDKVHVLTHSMGGRLPVTSLAARPPDIKLYHLMLAAADVRTTQFEDNLPGVLALSARVTIYASEWDQALRCSLWVNSIPRVGQGGEHVVVKPNVDTIDVSAVEKPWLLDPARIPCTPFGHAHTSRNPAVLADLYTLVTHHTPPVNRQRLHPETKNSLPYWLLK